MGPIFHLRPAGNHRAGTLWLYVPALNGEPRWRGWRVRLELEMMLSIH
jgi:hypothetical protein